MKSIVNIRQFYTPIQPAARKIGGNVNYNEFFPDVRLQKFIYCYWQLETRDKLIDEYKYRVDSDGCIDVFFELENPQENFVMGFSKTFVEFPLEDKFNYIGIRFLPAVFTQIFKINAEELNSQCENLHFIVPSLSKFIEQSFHDKLVAEELVQILDCYFLKVVYQNTIMSDSRFNTALEIILKKKGMLHIEKDIDAGISSRQLRRLFEFYIGDSAKTFSKVVRFQNILKANCLKQESKYTDLLYDSGYFDQSHFIKEFKCFYGETPSVIFNE
ncbi:AraC family transcriptional regulator [Myroides guanonis]|uniref:Helix-turn-helix domain-containing protein n=1 Tax=Myroides guanonis TaxID=1150112 RepID=A0A1I3LJ36_9FLAO|nr:helix-turn-helix domain-containing protein [Myroides guanonis]SFI84741.1 Helix-turn-helix domain-containing protein [Myroides guanonis]